jgi:hypothetical protein
MVREHGQPVRQEDLLEHPLYQPLEPEIGVGPGQGLVLSELRQEMGGANNGTGHQLGEEPDERGEVEQTVVGLDPAAVRRWYSSTSGRCRRICPPEE